MNAVSFEGEGADPDAGLADGAWPGADEEDPADGLDEPADGQGAAAAAALPATSDAQLAAWIDAVVDHDDRALAALYDATCARIFAAVRRIVRREALTEEVVEDTYFQVWRQAVRFDPGRGQPMTWLLAMARSRAIDALRREARFQHESLDERQAFELEADTGSADELLDLARHHAELHKALLGLSPQPRQLVSLAFFRGLSHEEIAAHMGLPLGTVKSQIRRALVTLRQTLGDNLPLALAP